MRAKFGRVEKTDIQTYIQTNAHTHARTRTHTYTHRDAAALYSIWLLRISCYSVPFVLPCMHDTCGGTILHGVSLVEYNNDLSL